MRKLPEYVAEEAARLKAIYRERKKKDPSLTQERLAHSCGWEGQSVVSQYLNGRIPLNLTALIKFSLYLGFPMSEVSPRLAPPGSHLDHSLSATHITPADPQEEWKAPGDNVIFLSKEEHDSLGGAPRLETIEVWDDDTPLGPDEIELPFFKEVEISAGRGSEVCLETTGRKLRFGKRTLQRKGINAADAACVTVTGNSMEPVLPNGSTAGVDTSMTTIIDGQMYAIDHAGQLRVKILYRLPAGGIRFRSYNSDEHPDERYDGDYVAAHIRIIGKVFWYSVLI